MKTITYDETEWQMVPKAPTEEMKDAAMDILLHHGDIYANSQGNIVIETITPADLLRAMLKTAPTHLNQPTVQDREDAPDRTGIYAWIDGSSVALVLIDKRPSDHSPGGTLNGHIIDSTRFYDGCAVEDWGAGRWVLLHDFDAARAAKESDHA